MTSDLSPIVRVKVAGDGSVTRGGLQDVSSSVQRMPGLRNSTGGNGSPNGIVADRSSPNPLERSSHTSSWAGAPPGPGGPGGPANSAPSWNSRDAHSPLPASSQGPSGDPLNGLVVGGPSPSVAMRGLSPSAAAWGVGASPSAASWGLGASPSAASWASAASPSMGHSAAAPMAAPPSYQSLEAQGLVDLGDRPVTQITI